MKFNFILLLTLALIVLVESVSIATQLPRQWPPLSLKVPKGRLILELEENRTLNSNQDLRAKLILNSPDEAIIGVDAILTFDPKATTIKQIVGNDEFFEQIIINRHQEEKGRIKITAFLPKKEIRPQATLAFLTVRLLQTPPAVIGIEFLGLNISTDSNLITTNQKDILGGISPLVIKTVEADKNQ